MKIIVQRILTGICLFFSVIPCFFNNLFSHYFRFIYFSLIFLIAFLEIIFLVKSKREFKYYLLFSILLLVFSLLLFLLEGLIFFKNKISAFFYIPIVFLLPFFCLFTYMLFFLKFYTTFSYKKIFNDLIHFIVPIFILAYSFHFFLKIEYQQQEIFYPYLFLYLLIIVISNDVTAYFIGTFFGKHKLTAISPNKTIEGLLAGIFISFTFSTIFSSCFLYNKYPFILSLNLILPIIANFGDLFFSAVKRYFNVKDYSKILGAHGGILDRLDSFLFCFIFFYPFFNYCLYIYNR